MQTKPRKRPRIGDVIEFDTPRGLAYAQYTHKHDKPPKYGALLRVFPGTHEQRPASLANLVRQTPQFLTFFPLGAACSRGIVRIAGNESVPSDAQAFPTFRSGFRGADGQVKKWFLWDGEKEWSVAGLSPEMRSWPLRGIWNDTLLIERILSGWKHEHDI